jgi:hypothetical protein
MTEPINMSAESAEPGTPGRAASTPWLPTSANINALPEGVRNYIHDLETRCDPAGDVVALTLLRAQEYALQQELTRTRIKAGDYHDAYKGMAKECCELRSLLRGCRQSAAAKQVECDALRAQLKTAAEAMQVVRTKVEDLECMRHG